MGRTSEVRDFRNKPTVKIDITSNKLKQSFDRAHSTRMLTYGCIWSEKF